MMWTPYQIEIILHHACSSAPFTRHTAPLYAETIEHLRELGVIDGNGPWTVTSLGHALIEMWCNTPLPIQRFVDPRFEKGPAT